MPIINETFDIVAAAKIKRFKAPKGKIYNIHSITFIIMTNGTNLIMVLDRYVEEERLDIDPVDEDLIACASCNSISGHPLFLYPDPVKTKYLTIGTNTNVACLVSVVINYTLTNISTKDSILEYIMKKS